MANPSDIGLFLNEDGIYDVTLAANGDLTPVYGMETAILMTFLCERRADVSEIANPTLQRGWWGNQFSNVYGYEIGSKNWLLYQSRNVPNTANRAVIYNQEAFQWMIEDNLLDSINVTAVQTTNNIKINIEFLRSNNVDFTESFNLWQNTGTNL